MGRVALRPSIADLLRMGSRAVSKYTGTVFAVFVVQSLLAAACMLAIAVLLAQAFAHLPMWDDAVDGSLVSLIYCVRFARPSFLAIGGIVFGTLVAWQLVAWFLAGGLYGVFAQRPEGRRETARCFGANGATTYLAFARLALCSLPSWFFVAFLFGAGFSFASDRIEYALTVPQLLGPLAIACVPGLLVMHLAWTITEYARVELVLRGGSHDPGALATYLRTCIYVVKHPVTLVHGGIGWLFFVLVTVAYAYLAQGHPMYGAEGAITLFFVRQGVSLLRMAIKIGILAGQVELGNVRELPPRRVEPKPAAS